MDFDADGDDYFAPGPETAEHAVTCPSCWQQVTIVLDPSAGSQTYVEDCEVCCQPMVISFEVFDGVVTNVSADPET